MSLIDEINHIKECSFFKDYDLTKMTTMRLKSNGDLVKVKSISALQELLPLLKKYQRNYFVLGWGANQILPQVCKDVVIYLDFHFDHDYLLRKRSEYWLPASLGLNHLTSHAVKFNLLGWEVFTGIPASLGGAVFMNAGTALGEIGTLVKKVKLVTNLGEIKEITIDEKSFSYRKNHFVEDGEVIVEVLLGHKGVDQTVAPKIKDYLQYRKNTQPLATRNCGCVFKNLHPKMSSGKLIDLLGFKNLSFGDLKISSKHGNFFENRSEASFEDFQNLVSTVKEYAEIFYGLEFELEVKIPYHH